MLRRRLAVAALLAAPAFPASAGAQDADIVIDNTDPQARVVTGTWWAVTSGNDFLGSNFFTALNSLGNEFRWTPTLTAVGTEYDVYVRYASDWHNLGTDAPYTVAHDGGLSVVTVDQTQGGGTWVPLGRYALSPGAYIALGDTLSGNRRPSADAVRLVAAGTVPPPPAEIVIDNSSPAAGPVAGNWWNVNNGSGYEGQDFMTSASPAGEFRWTPALPAAAADYDVYVKYATGWPRLGSDAPYTVVHAGGADAVDVDQTQNGGQWVLLGRYAMREGSYVALGAALSGSARPSADAVRLVAVGATPPDAVDAVPDTATTNAGTAVVIDVLANDTGGAPLSISSVTQAANGTVATNGARVTYTPAAGFAGNDSFAYTATDGASSDTATVTVLVNAPTPDAGLNVLFIAIDDLRPELGTYGVAAIHTPNLDALAAQGTRFNRAYAQMATCSPSRTSLMTGLRPDTAGVTDLKTHFRDTVPEVVTLPQYFRNNGYRSAGYCKVYHPQLDDAASWSEPYQNAGGPEAPRGADGKKLPYAAFDTEDRTFGDYKCANLAINAIQSAAADNVPFFIAVGFKKPHLPFVAPRRYFDMYDANTIPVATNPFKAQGAPSVAFENRSELRNYSGIPPASQPMSESLERELKRGYYAATTFVDDQVGRVLAALEAAGKSENTIVVVFGDHGFHLGEQYDWAKHTNFDVGTRVPLIIRVPGGPANQATDALAELVDLYPTVVELAGLPVPGPAARGGYPLEGDSLVPFVTEPATASRRGAFSQWRRNGYVGYSIRTTRYRYTEWTSSNNRQLELYDHSLDPDETTNLAGRAAYADVEAELQAALDAGGKVDLPPALR